MPTLRAYLLVEQHRKRVTHHWRDAAGRWQSTDLSGSGVISLPCPETELTLDQIYEDVEMPPLGVAEPEAVEAYDE